MGKRKKNHAIVVSRISGIYRDIMLIRNGRSDPIPNPGRSCLHFTMGLGMNPITLPLAMSK